MEVLELVRRLDRDLGRTVVMVLHDISPAARFCDQVVAMQPGRVVAHGTPEELITEELPADVFGLRAQIVPEPVADRPHVIPLGRAAEPTGATRPAAHRN